jgi:hypothetical protein
MKYNKYKNDPLLGIYSKLLSATYISMNYYTSHTFFYINFIAIKILFPWFQSICLKSTIHR